MKKGTKTKSRRDVMIIKKKILPKIKPRSGEIIITMYNTRKTKSRRDDMIIEDGMMVSPLRGSVLCGVGVYYNNNIPSGLKPMVQ